MQMPFGKHKGEVVHTLPRDYLAWLKKNVDLKGDLLRAVDAGLQGRRFQPPTIKERVDEAKKEMFARLRQREAPMQVRITNSESASNRAGAASA